MTSSDPRSMTLGALCAEAGLNCPPGADDIPILGVSADSRRVRPGFLFVAVSGMHRDGRDCIPDAAARGAAAAAAAWDDNDCPAAITGAPIPLTRVGDAREASARLLDAWYGHPGKRLRLVGITGTNGKTSTACMLAHILRASGERVGMIGTLGYRLPDDAAEPEEDVIRPADSRAAMTTPDPEELYAILDRMADGGTRRTTVVMEVSSHALALGKTAPLDFEVGIFTNLSPEHTDFHETAERYFEAKKQLFRASRIGVTNGGDPCGARLPREVTGPQRWIVCRDGSAAPDVGTVEPAAPFERCGADDVRLDGLRGVGYRLITPSARLRVTCPVPGIFTVINSLEAAAAALALGVQPAVVREALSGFPGVPGRMERLPLHADYDVFIDYAHTPDALEKLLCSFHRILDTARMSGKGRLILLFGCGGDRDRDKRKVMARIASALADVIIITSDNSRSEDPDVIIGDILRGIDKESEYTVIPDRAEAIRWAVRSARPGDVILLCGKGHETYEIDRTGRHPFDERAVVRAAMEGRTD